MTPLEASTWLVADSLERGRPAGDGLDQLGAPLDVSRAAAGPTLEPLLRSLGIPDDARRLAALWPRALGAALRRLEGLPDPLSFRVRLGQTLAYLALIAVLQLVVIRLLSAKVFPVLRSMQEDFPAGGALIDASEVVSALVVLGCLPVMAWVVLGAAGWSRLPGWGRHLARAREALLAAALLESQPPDDVRRGWLGQARWLSDPALVQWDLEAVASEASVSAERAMQGFLSRVRVVGLALLTFNALGVLITVYGVISLLPGGVS